LGWLILEAADPQSKGALERSHRFMRTNFESARRFANEHDCQLQFDAWADKVNRRKHRGTRAVVCERLAEELRLMAPLPERMPASTAGSSPASRSSPTCASTPTTTRSTRASPAAGSSFVPASASSSPSPSTPPRSRPATGAPSPST
jgi:hypothetical protein